MFDPWVLDRGKAVAVGMLLRDTQRSLIWDDVCCLAVYLADRGAIWDRANTVTLGPTRFTFHCLDPRIPRGVHVVTSRGRP